MSFMIRSLRQNLAWIWSVTGVISCQPGLRDFYATRKKENRQFDFHLIHNIDQFLLVM